MRNQMQNENRYRSKPKKSILATPVSISKHSSTWQSVCNELSKHASIRSPAQSSGEVKKELFFPLFHPPNRKVLKHPGWWKKAVEAMGSTLVRTTRGDQIGTLKTSRTKNSPCSQSGSRPFNDIAYLSDLPLSHTVKVDSFSQFRSWKIMGMGGHGGDCQPMYLGGIQWDCQPMYLENTLLHKSGLCIKQLFQMERLHPIYRFELLERKTRKVSMRSTI